MINEQIRDREVRVISEAGEQLGIMSAREAMKLAEEIAAQAPIAVSLCKEAINVGMQTDLNSALKFEGNVFGQCFATEDQKYGMAYFLDKNKEKPAKEFKNK